MGDDTVLAGGLSNSKKQPQGIQRRDAGTSLYCILVLVHSSTEGMVKMQSNFFIMIQVLSPNRFCSGFTSRGSFHVEFVVRRRLLPGRQACTC